MGENFTCKKENKMDIEMRDIDCFMRSAFPVYDLKYFKNSVVFRLNFFKCASLKLDLLNATFIPAYQPYFLFDITNILKGCDFSNVLIENTKPIENGSLTVSLADKYSHRNRNERNTEVAIDMKYFREDKVLIDF